MYKKMYYLIVIFFLSTVGYGSHDLEDVYPSRVSRVANNPLQDILAAIPSNTPDMGNPLTQTGKNSLGCYLGCLECITPWLRCSAYPSITAGVFCATATASLNILLAAGAVDEAHIISGIGAGFAIGTLISKVYTSFVYRTVDLMTEETRKAQIALKLENQQLEQQLEVHKEALTKNAEILNKEIERQMIKQEAPPEDIAARQEKVQQKLAMPGITSG